MNNKVIKLVKQWHAVYIFGFEIKRVILINIYIGNCSLFKKITLLKDDELTFNYSICLEPNLYNLISSSPLRRRQYGLLRIFVVTVYQCRHYIRTTPNFEDELAEKKVNNWSTCLTDDSFVSSVVGVVWYLHTQQILVN